MDLIYIFKHSPQYKAWTQNGGNAQIKTMVKVRKISELSVIEKVLKQEQKLFAGEKVSDRMVSIDRHYTRLIVRGKETKSVELHTANAVCMIEKVHKRKRVAA